MSRPRPEPRHELSYYVLPRYREAVAYLPWVHYCPEAMRQMHPGQAIAANAWGYFNDDGSDYERFRRWFLHEVGHKVYRQQHGDFSEEAADLYRAQMEWELQTASADWEWPDRCMFFNPAREKYGNATR